jgi:beta-glucosidase
MRLGFFLSCLLVIPALSSCSGGAEDDSVIADFSISATPSRQTAGSGGSTTFNVVIGATAGFARPIVLNATGLPDRATSSFTPGSVDGSGTCILRIATITSTPNANSTVTITGSSGGLVHSTTVMLVTVNAEHIVEQMSLEQTIQQLHGIQDVDDYRVVPGISSLGIPRLNITNGPAGATNGGPGHQGPATALPAPISLAATWDVNLANLYGSVVGSEAKALANGLVEGPDINITRVPQGGRTFETYGEDPYLAGEMAVANIQGIQSQGVIAESKHFVANNQETNRTAINELIDERTLREIYLSAFEATIKHADVGAVMCAYNKVNGVYMCENDKLLNQILKHEWGFQGFVTSDFGATHSTVASANAGLDLEMPTGVYFGSALQSAVTASQVAQSVLNEHLIRRFNTMMKLGVFTDPPRIGVINSQQDGVIARQIAEAGMVLLRNEGAILPLNASNLRTIAVIGPYASLAKTGGGGSSMVIPAYTVAPVTGIQERAGSAVTVSYDDGGTISTAVTLAQASDVAIVMVGDSETEGSDNSISLTGNQDALVQAIVAANPKTIVVLKSGTAILMPWASEVPAILEAWYAGEEDGNAVAAVLFGDVNPSGKLPLTFPANLSDVPANTPIQYPGVNGVVSYNEGIFVGYRHYDENNITPLFPFGFGLSYTSFSFTNLAITPASVNFSNNNGEDQNVTVSLNVTNTGTALGAEVVQLYVGMPSTAVPEPPKWLKGFQKLSLAPGETGQVQLTLNERSFSYWDVNSSRWAVVPGTYEIMVGSSSRDIRVEGQISIN